MGRGYPDISLAAAYYSVVLGGEDATLFGTSASTPVLSAMVTLVNSRRLQAGKSALGWINPSLYSVAQSSPEIILNDVVSGENNCAAEG